MSLFLGDWGDHVRVKTLEQLQLKRLSQALWQRLIGYNYLAAFLSLS